MAKKPEIHESWLPVLATEFEKEYFQKIKQTLLAEKNAGQLIYPPGPLLFNAFNSTPFSDLKVVILGQDPYHGEGQAHGLSFSVPDGVKVPPSLKNIYKEIHADLGHEIPDHGNLSSWSEQGVFLLNAMLTVRAKEAGSHSKIGWQTFTDAVISAISNELDGIIFLLWGNFAKSKIGLINESKHFVLTAAHPSPFSAYNGFFGCEHFSLCNQFLKEQGKEPIIWDLN